MRGLVTWIGITLGGLVAVVALVLVGLATTGTSRLIRSNGVSFGALSAPVRGAVGP